ncbi:hypothetical protein DL98DRAFT_520353 [Cadophora sp. DSE1049]|nr:hypothetical protein DL98DRAFT_520353 [Cadophora sp. DSE1049]
MAQQELVAGIECTEYESSSSTPQNWCCENIVPECTMSEAGETGVHFADADLPPPKRNVKKNGQPTSNTTFTQGSSSVNLAIGHTSTAAPSREPNSSTQQSTVTKPAVLTSQGSNIPRPKTGFAFPSKPATKVPTNPIVAAHLGGAVTVGQSHGNAYGAPVSNTLSHNATPGPRLGVFHHNCVPSNANTSKPGDRLTNRGQTVPASHNTQAPQPRPSQIPRGGGFSGSRGGSMNAIFGNHLPAPSSSAVAASASTLRPTRASGRTTSTKGKSDGGRPSRGGR